MEQYNIIININKYLIFDKYFKRFYIIIIQKIEIIL